MTKRLTAWMILASAIAGGCVARPTPPATGTADDSPHYNLTAKLFPLDRRLEVSGTIQLPAADTSRGQITLSLTERMRDFRVEVVQPLSHAGPVAMQRVAEDRGSVKWVLRPANPFPSGHRILLRFSAAGDGGIATMYYVGPEVAFASAWGTDWYPVAQDGLEKGTGTLTVTAPVGWSVATGGVRGSTDSEEGKGTFRSTIPYPTYFSFTAGTYEVVRHAGRVPMSAYLLTPRQHSAPYLQGVASIMDVLTNEFGPFPFSSLTLVEVPRDLANRAGFNAVSAAGLLVLNSRAFDAPDSKYLLEWLGHELGHQWFPHTVALHTPPGLYMEEALAEYGGLRVVETIAGAAAAKQLRMTGFEYDPIYSALAYFKSVGAGVDQPLNDLQPRLEHRNLAYTKGALVFDMLSRELGRSDFQRILHELTQRYRFQSFTWQEFLAAIELGAGRDLAWFYEQWFQRTGAPDFRVSWNQQGDTLRGVITQAEPYYRARLRVSIRDSETEVDHFLETTEASVGFAVPVGFRVTSVILDPNFEVLRWTSEYRAAADTARSGSLPRR